MGVEVMSSKQSQVSAETAEGNSSMKFGSVGETAHKGEMNNGSVNGELSKAPEGNVPNNVREEWPEPAQIHLFYAVKYRPYEDEKLKGQLDQSDKELQKIYRARSALLEKLRPLRGERQQLMSLIIPLNNERKQFRAAIDEKRKEMEPLQKNLGQLRNTMGGGGRERGGGGGREKGSGLCSSEAELNAYIKSLQYRIQHESITLNEEKQILREIKQLESTREKVIANAVTRAKIEESVGDKETLQEQVKLIGVDLDGVRKEQDAVMTKLKKLEAEKGAIDEKIKLIEEELNDLDLKKKKANESLDGLKAKLRDVNGPFYQNNNVLKKFRDVAAQKDIESLKQDTEAEVENFVSQWASKKAFREDYERRILLSLDMRQLTKDGRMRNPDEKPLVRPSAVVPSEAITKQPKEDVSTQKKDAAASVEKVSKEKVSKVQKEANNKKKDGLDQSDHATGKGADSDFVIPQKDPPKVEKVDMEKLKEIKREEEIAKNKQALERKKKLAEKAAAKAALKAQKEAEEKQKKQKEREKKARKRAGPSGAAAESQEESNETDGVEQEAADEDENAMEKIEQATPAQKRERKETGIRSRPRPRATGSLPKAILKRKKATNYWPYAAAAAAVVVLLLLAIGYNYFI